MADYQEPDWVAKVRETYSYQQRQKALQGPGPLLPMFDQPYVYTRENYTPTTPAMGPQETVQQMPNYDRLTPSERWLYSKLPGFSQSVPGKFMQWVGKSWAGKALGYLDFAAEGVERLSGLAIQYNAAKDDPAALQDFTQNLQSAWYAGGLAADMTNLPTMNWDGTRVSSVSVPSDLPGSAGLVQARKRIQELIAQGIPAGQALIQARQEYYNDLGALQLRAQLYDTYWHVLADPLNYILPSLKPVERVTAAGKAIRATNWADDVVEGARIALKAAEDTGDFSKVWKVAESAGITDITRTALTQAQQAGDVKKAIGLINEYVDTKALTRTDKFVLALTGKMDPFKAQPRTFWHRINPFGLTPASRAQELMTVVQDNIGNYILSRFDEPTDIYKAINSAMNGATGNEFGHAFMTIEGRAVQGLLGGIDANLQPHLATWLLTANERAALNGIASALGEDAYKVMASFEAGDFQAVARRLGNVDASELERIYGLLKGTAYTPDLWKLKAGNVIADYAAQQGVLMFGVKARGLLEKIALATKSAETLAFLRLNPGYLVRNVVNNEMTNIARIGSTFGVDIDGFWKMVGWEPPRLGQGFGAIGVGLEAGTETGSTVIAEALRGEPGALTRFSDYIGKLKLGGLDMGELSAKAERAASRRAFTVGYQQGWKNYFWKPQRRAGDVGFTPLSQFIDDATRQALDAVDPEIAQAIERAVSSSFSERQVDDLVRGNLNITPDAILNKASQELGYDVGKVLPDSFKTKYFGDEFVAAMREGRLPEYMAGVRKSRDAHLAEISEQYVKQLADDIATRVELEGPAYFFKAWGDGIDEFQEAHIAHDLQMAELNYYLRNIHDPELAHKFWNNLFQRNETYWSKQWDRLDATVRGLKKGANKLGIPVPDEVTGAFKQVKDSWRGFYKTRKSTLDAFFEARLKKQPPPMTWDEIKTKLNAEYKAAVDLEDTLTRRIDRLVSQSIEGEVERAHFLAWRKNVADLRLADKQAVIEFRQSLEGLSPDRIQELYAKFWPQRAARMEEMRQAEKTGLQMMQGDAQAAAKFTPAVEAQRIAEEEFFQWFGESKIVDAEGRPLRVYHGTKKDFVDFERQTISDLGFHFGDLETATLATTGPERVISVGGNIRPAYLKIENPLRIDDLGTWNGKKISRWLLAQDDEKLKIVGQDIDNAIEELYEKGIQSIHTEQEAVYKALLKNGYDGFVYHNKYEVAGDSYIVLDNSQIKNAMGIDIYGVAPKATPPVAAAPTPAAAAPTPAPARAFIADSEKLVPKPEPVAVAESQFWLSRGDQALDAIERQAVAQAGAKPLKWDNLPKEAQDAIERYLTHVKGQMGDARYASTRFGEFKRDAALLNYNRRFNYNTWLGIVMPYEFWMTQSMFKWALHSIDRPAMLTTYLRMREMLETGGAPNQALPSRLKRHIRIELPFLPDWMGNTLFIDPMKLALPFDTFLYPFEEYQRKQQGQAGGARRMLAQMVESGEITQAEADEADASEGGPIWEQALQKAVMEDEELKMSAWDFASLMSSPHAPLVWAKEVADGTPENIGPFTPMSRTLKGVAGLLGIDWDNSPLNLEARLRKQLGLPAFDKWDDYRVERMLSNMAARGEIPVDEALRAMIDHQGPGWEEATRKANIEFGVGAVGSALGLPSRIYPEGEFLQRSLVDDLKAAYAKKEAGDPDAEGIFWDMHPEAATRLALWKTPEEKLQKFLTDNLWNIYLDMPKMHKDQLKETLGNDFQELFLNQETRNYESIPLETLQVWLKLAGGNPPGTLTQTPTPIDYAPDDVAYRAGVFYDMRKNYFPDYYELQDTYFKLPEKSKARRDYLKSNPQLTDYWDWRNDWLHRNPDVVPYLTDKYTFEYSSAEMVQRARENQPWFTWQEWQMALGPSMSNLLLDYFDRGDNLPAPAETRLEQLAEQYGVDRDRMLELIEQSLR